MVLDPKETVVAYRCPKCGSSIISLVGVFSLSGDMMRLKCSCGESELQMTKSSDGRIRLNVPCLVCSKPHNYTLSLNTFFGTDRVFTIPCALTGIDLCFIGKKDAVLKALDDANNELVEMMQNAGLEDLEDIKEPDDLALPNREITEIVRYMIKELNDEGLVKCCCQNNAIADFDFELNNGELRIFCTECGAQTVMPMTSVNMARDFIECSELVLTRPNEKK